MFREACDGFPAYRAATDTPMNDFRNSEGPGVQLAGEEVLRQEFAGEVIDVTADDIRVMFETEEGRIEQTYEPSQFSSGYVPEIGDRLVAVRVLSLKRKMDGPSETAAERHGQQEERWSAENDARRCQLIDKKIQRTISPAESRELAELQRQALDHFDQVAPPPIEGARKLHQRLLAMQQQREG
jgi:DNA-directed RNA polymerase subunit F